MNTVGTGIFSPVKAFRDLRIRFKLISVTLFLVLLPLLSVSYLSMERFSNAIRKAYDEDLEHLVGSLYAMCSVQEETLQGISLPDRKAVSEKSMAYLKDIIGDITVGDTGYAYVIDSRGTLKIHPAKEGENIIDSRDSSGFQYIRAMVEDATSLAKGQVGTIRYPWFNPELGEKRPRQKISKYVYFRPWDWIIVAGSYEEEIYRDLRETERFILAVVLGCIILGFILTLGLSKVLTRPIQELTAVTARMAGGDLSQRVKVTSKDEIGTLGESFNRMVSQIAQYTTNLEKMVETRTLELKASREKYKELSLFLNQILDSATEYAIMALDFYGNIIEFNRGAEKILGWKKEELVNKENIAVTITHEEREKKIQEMMSRKTRTEGVCDLEMVRLRKDGSRFPAHTTITAIINPEGRVTGFVEILRDITQRKTLERELRETKEFLENIMESSVDGILTTDLKGKITYNNRAMEEMLGFTRQQIIGAHISRFYERGIEQAREVMGLLRKYERAENYEMVVLRRDGSKLSIITSLFLLRDEEGDVIGTAGIFKDITAQKLLEDKLKTTQAQLVEASKMRALGELVSGVAHELNNPLMASQTILHVIFKNLHDNCPNRERLELIQQCNDRIARIVDHLREFSRQTRMERKPIHINQIIQNALMITGQQLIDHDIAIVKELREDLPMVLGDSSQLEQVFLNLISNARDAMEEADGEKTLSIATDIERAADSSAVTVSIRDTGVGIPEENMGKIFDPFFSTKPVGKGTGLGLSLCFGIIEAHGGRIEIRSRVGEGTEAKVFLPAVNNQDSGAGPSGENGANAGE
ncbi:MAG: PAS domain S-box protein [Deltaproteobacteria bacterium]|nr:PAS domain S-box protein [Deltaproteobacteria bacterium]MBW2064797.1 PAS domain S-box protein [Deltaproteobacteria bacterium]